ncbi:MAG: hypothetical protein FJ220_06740 [Kiritimatiellaceae bacterium]|nr:hypothetical protein [Kiritimatiellaceae bacterium]
MVTLSVQKVRWYSPDIFELSLERGAYDFETGECAVLLDESGDSRPYSIASAPSEPVLRFVIRRLPEGAVSGWLSQRQPGDRIRVSPPFGEFRPQLADHPVVLIANGVGIAPFLSLLRQSERVATHPVTCLYGVRTVQEAVELPLLQRMTTLHLAVSREQTAEHFYGRVTAMMPNIQLSEGASYYLCGSGSMLNEIARMLHARGVPFSRIYTEVFFR